MNKVKLFSLSGRIFSEDIIKEALVNRINEFGETHEIIQINIEHETSYPQEMNAYVLYREENNIKGE